MLFTLTNMREGSIRRIKISASDVRYPIQSFDEIPVLETGASVQVPFAVDFKVREEARGKVKSGLFLASSTSLIGLIGYLVCLVVALVTRMIARPPSS